MAEPTTFSHWYTDKSKNEGTVSSHGVFEQALAAFSAELSQNSEDKSKLEWIKKVEHGNLNGVLASVIVAREQYEARKKDSKVRRVLVEVSETIHHYSGIMDVLVSHHPEYTALAWGAMKVLFVGVKNQVTVLYRLSMGLIQIANILPRADLILQLYPTQQVKDVIMALYTNVLKFLLRALGWYRESKLKHIQHSITKPAELAYDDLLATITSLSHNMTEIAAASSHAEQRDIHKSIQKHTRDQECLQTTVDQLTVLLLDMRSSLATKKEQERTELKVDQLTALVHEMAESISTEQVINASARIEHRQILSEIQLAQFVGSLSVVPLADPLEALQAALFMSNRHRCKPSSRGPEFWLDEKLQKWNECKESSLVIVDGTNTLRNHLQSFCSDAIALLRQESVPVIWALKTVGTRETPAQQISTPDLLKYLISQAIKINRKMHTDEALTPRFGAYLSAQTDEEWANVLVSVLEGIPLLYIVIDVGILSHTSETPTKRFWPDGFLKILSGLSARSKSTACIIKVVMVSYCSPLFKGSSSKEYRDLIVSVGSARTTRMPHARPLYRDSNNSDRLDAHTGSAPDLGRLSQSGLGGYRSRLTSRRKKRD